MAVEFDLLLQNDIESEIYIWKLRLMEKGLSVILKTKSVSKF